MKKLSVGFVTFLIICQIVDSKGNGKTVHLSHKDRKMITNYFNDLRRDLYAADMREVSWYHTSAIHARRWGRQCEYREKWENLYGAALYKEPFDPIARPGEIVMNAIRSWAKQMTNNTRRGWKNCQRRGTCEYLQMIQSKLDSVGCSVSRCPNLYTRSHKVETDMHYVICFFSPRLTIHKEEPYRPGKRCTYCPENLICKKRMCSTPRRSRSSMRVFFDKNSNRISVPFNSSNGIARSRSSKPKHRWADVKTINVYGQLAPLPKSSTTNRITSSEISLHEPKGVVLKNRYLDDKGQIRIKKERKFYAQTQRRPSVIPSAPVKNGRVKRQARYDYEYERRRREQERQRRYQQRLREERRRRLQEERERERRRRNNRNRNQNNPAAITEVGPMSQTDKYYLEQVHNTLRGNGMGNLKWDNYLERWAKYVIRCDIEYPGPIDCYTNFGKVPMESDVYNVVYDWGQEGTDVFEKLQYGCRTPSDRERCNHNVIVRNEFLVKFGCAEMNCGRMKQLTCIYK